MTKKIFRSILTVGVAVLACSLLLVMGCFYGFYEGMQEHQLGDELRIAAAAVETNGSTYLEKIKSSVDWKNLDSVHIFRQSADLLMFFIDSIALIRSHAAKQKQCRNARKLRKCKRKA